MPSLPTVSTVYLSLYSLCVGAEIRRDIIYSIQQGLALRSWFVCHENRSPFSMRHDSLVTKDLLNVSWPAEGIQWTAGTKSQKVYS